MIFHIDTWYENQDGHGNSIACLKLELKHADSAFRDKVKEAIFKAFEPEQIPTQNQNKLGFKQE